MVGSEPYGGLSSHEWLARFKESAKFKVHNQLASEEDAGELLDLNLEPREDGVWAIATFAMRPVPHITFIRSQRVMPDLSLEWDPEFAATLFETHLIEWFHVDAKHRAPDESGTVRN